MKKRCTIKQKAINKNKNHDLNYTNFILDKKVISETFFDLLVSSLVSWFWLLFLLLLFTDLYWNPNADISEWIRAKQSTSGVGPIHRA